MRPAAHTITRNLCAFVLSAGLLPFSLAHAGEPRVYYDSLDETGRLTGEELLIDLTDPLQRAEYGELPAGFFMAAWPVTTVRDNGPSANRVDLVLVGDGYTAADMPKYALHVNNLLPAFFAQEPLKTYANYFNVHRVNVLSNESGVDELDNGIVKDTPLDMVYGCFGASQGLCINVPKATAAAASAPEVEQILALANSGRFGGAGYTSANLGTLAGNNSSAVEIALHEFGHAFADLRDEYDYGSTGPYTGQEFPHANATTFTAATLAASQWKWFRWLDLANVDTFEGGATYATGVYRPTLNSKMRSLGQPFEEVNAEQFIISIYKIVSPVDDATPASATPLSPCAQFFVTPLQPIGHKLDVQWKVNGVIVAGYSQPAFSVPADLLFAGVNVVTVTVVDNTPRVRDPSFRNSNMTFTRNWTILSTGDPGECDCMACGDLDQNGSIDLRDAAAFARCFSAHPFSDAACVCGDLNGDLQIDLTDLSALNGYLGSPPHNAHPLCLEP